MPLQFKSAGNPKSVHHLGLLGYLMIAAGMVPWLTLSAYGQAILLETNPAPEMPNFDIPTEVAPAPEPVNPEVAYDPEPYVEPAPEPSYAAEVSPAPYIAPEPAYEPEPYVEPTYAPPAPAVIAQPEPTYLEAEPAPTGCAALLDPSGVGSCGAPAAPTMPVERQPIIANTETAPLPTASRPTPRFRQTAKQPVIPPARQIQATTQISQSAIPPARQVVALPHQSQAIAAIQPQVHSGNRVIPNQTLIASANLTALPSIPSLNPTAGPPQGLILNQPNFTVVKPDRFSLKPLIGKTPLQWILGNQAMLFPLPIPVAVSSAFGWRQHPIQQHWHLHSGIDLAAPQGTPVVAVFDGQVAIADQLGGYGLTVLLSHGEGQRFTRYAHLSEIYVQPGKKVKQGDVIGSVGSTGNSTGPHLHFETLEKTPDGLVVVDPTEEIKSALINTLERMQALAKTSITTPQSEINPASQESINAAPINVDPIPVEVIEPLTGYQARAELSQPQLVQ